MSVKECGQALLLRLPVLDVLQHDFLHLSWDSESTVQTGAKQQGDIAVSSQLGIQHQHHTCSLEFLKINEARNRNTPRKPPQYQVIKLPRNILLVALNLLSYLPRFAFSICLFISFPLSALLYSFTRLMLSPPSISDFSLLCFTLSVLWLVKELLIHLF